MKYILSFCLIIISLNSLFGQSTNKNTTTILVKGQVVDTTGVGPIGFASVKLYDEKHQLQKAAAAGDDGKFTITAANLGKYSLEVSYLGMENLVKNIDIDKKGTLELGKLEMKSSSTNLAEVIVSAARPLVTVDFDKLSYSIADDPDSKSNNVLEMLKKVPLITVDGEDKIQLKGSSNYKIYLNGKPSNMISSNPKEVLKSMPANTVKDIQVITDPGAKYDAEGVAGIINIITINQSSLGGFTASLNAGASTFGGYDAGAYLMLKYGKIGFIGNFSRYAYKSPGGKYTTEREDYTNSVSRYLNQDGTSSYDGAGQYGSGEISFEIDTFNLVNVGFSGFTGNGVSLSDLDVAMRDINSNLVDRYLQSGNSTNSYGSVNANVDYQRTFMTPQRLLTFSYRYSYSPSDWSNNADVDSVFGYTRPRKSKQSSDAGTDEHTLQIDYTTPFAKIHTFEAGLKYIYRLNYSNSNSQEYDQTTDSWMDINSDIDEFRHNSGIVGVYGSYSIKLNKWGFKTGVRYEGTFMNVNYPINNSRNFNMPFSNNFVPSATVTYKITDMQNLRFGYNKRISRPGIDQLNPYVDNSNSNYIRYGNPNLKPVDNHSLSLNYGLFQQKFNLNANVSYSFQNNSIESITTVEDGVNKTTYDNIGENQSTNLSVYLSWSPIEKLRFSVNSWGGYIDIKANDNSGLANSGFTGGGFLSGNYIFPYKINLSVSGGIFSPGVQLTGSGSTFAFHNISVSKSFLSEKLDVRVSMRSPFQKERQYTNKEQTNQYSLITKNVYLQRELSVSVSFKFGEMKEQIKKTSRSISNDDVMSSGSSGQGGAGASTGGGR